MTTTERHLARGAAARWLGVWVLTIIVLAIAVVPPERCSTPSLQQLEDSAAAATGWLVANQFDDDEWRYEFDRASATDLPGYNIVRHAGVMTALYQRHAWVGDQAAFDSAERGLTRIEEDLVVAGDGLAVREPDGGSTGGSALLLAALVFRRDGSGETDRDPEIEALARFLVGQQLESGAISDRFDLVGGRPVPDAFSPFSTGEAMWALAMAGDRLGVPEWRDAARLTLDYVALVRDDLEEEFPPNDDHWAGYALGELAPDGLEEHHRDYVRRLAGLWSAEVRFDSQRTGEGLNRLVRGGVGRDAVQGTNLEGMTGLWRAAAVDEGLADVRDDLTDRIACAADMLSRRQVTAAEAAGDPIPEATAGAWFRDGTTRMDTQQHALGGLTGAAAVLGTTDPPPGAEAADVVEVLAAGVLLAALLVPRRRWAMPGVEADRTTGRRDLALLALALTALLTAVAVGPTALEAGDVSVTTARLAVGLLAMAVLVAGWLGREVRPWRIAAWYPPAAVTAAVLAADLGRIAAGAAIAVALVLAASATELRRHPLFDGALRSGREAFLVLAATAAVVAGAIGL